MNDNELPEVLDGDPENWMRMLNARDFIEKTLTDNPRIKVGGAGCGESCADLDITIDGARFNILIRPKEM